MAAPHVIVGHILKLDPLVSLTPAGFADLIEGHVRVHFADGEIAKLQHKDPAFERRHNMVTRMHQAGIPAYVEVEPESRLLETLRIPDSGRVYGLFHDAATGDVTLQLDNSAKPFTLPRRHPRFEDYFPLLIRALTDRETVVVTENDRTGELIDIRRAARLAAPPAPVEPEAPPPRLEALSLPAAAAPASPADVLRMFRLVAEQTCDLAAPNRTCIPFRYPDNGCHARAHRMCRLIADAGFEPLKVWNYSTTPKKPLVVQTEDAPGCQVKWSFHVAAVLLQTNAAGKPDPMVIDPALFPDDGPVPVARWHGRQGPQDSCLVYTTPEPYLLLGPADVVYDPHDSLTIQELEKYRLLLEDRAADIPFHCAKRRAVPAG